MTVAIFACSYNSNTKLSYRRGTARRTVSVEIWSTNVHLYKTITYEKACSRYMTLKIT